MNEELLKVCKRMQRDIAHTHLLSLQSKAELIEIIDGLINSVDALEEKHTKLIAELEGLHSYDGVYGSRAVDLIEIESLIDKYKGGEVDGLSQCSRTT